MAMMRRLPLNGIRVLDLSRILAGPWATQLLGDLGADVIKVEVPLRGDDTRSWGPPFLGGVSSYYLSANRNKRSIAVDFKNEAGLAIIQQLAGKSDVVVENFLPGKLIAAGLGYEELSSLNPRLIYASISGYGDCGPMSQRPGYDLTASAHGGLMDITGPAGGDPCKVGVALTDVATGIYLQSGILAALFQREKTGQGCHLSTSLLETVIANLANVGSSVLLGGTDAVRRGSAHESIVVYEAFAAADNKQLIVAAANDAQFKTLCRVIGAPQLAEDGRYRTNADRVVHREPLVAFFKERIKTRTRAEWLVALSEAGVTVAAVNTIKEALNDVQVQALEMIQSVQHPGIGRAISLTRNPVNYAFGHNGGGGSEPPADTADTGPPPSRHLPIRLPPPGLGQHTREVLAEVLDWSSEQIEDAMLSGAVCGPSPNHGAPLKSGGT